MFKYTNILFKYWTKQVCHLRDKTVGDGGPQTDRRTDRQGDKQT